MAQILSRHLHQKTHRLFQKTQYLFKNLFNNTQNQRKVKWICFVLKNLKIYLRNLWLVQMVSKMTVDSLQVHLQTFWLKAYNDQEQETLMVRDREKEFIKAAEWIWREEQEGLISMTNLCRGLTFHLMLHHHPIQPK